MQKDPRLLKIGRQIRKLRERAGYSQEAFATEAGLDRAYYGGVERGERNISSLNLILIAATLKVEVGELFPAIKILKKAK
jgi:transcriptional regulator with XRE-family HTH domain